MSKEMYFAIAVVIALIIVVLIVIKRRKMRNQMITYLEKRDYDSFKVLVNSFLAKFLFTPFDLDYLKLNAAFMMNDKEDIKNMFEHLEHSRLNYKQKQDIYMKGFNYYISLENKNGAKKYLDLVHTLNNAQMDREVNRIYDIYCEKGYKYLDEMISELDDMADMYKGVNEFLISLMYENKGDKKKAKEYHNLAEKHMALLDRKIKQNHKEEKRQKSK